MTTRIKIEDLPGEDTLSAEELRNTRGGFFGLMMGSQMLNARYGVNPYSTARYNVNPYSTARYNLNSGPRWG